MTTLLKAAMTLALTLALAPMTRAAEFTYLTGAAEPDRRSGEGRARCNIRMAGQIQKGDADRFRAMVKQLAPEIEKDRNILGNPKVITLCLNSPGGALGEAVHMAEFIRQNRVWGPTGIPFVVTRLEAGALCESACAIVFLSGTMDDFEGPSFPARSMHPTARLGIHAPALNIQKGQYSESVVTRAYDVSVNAIAEILRVLYVGAAADGTPYDGDQAWIRASMLERMLQTPSSGMSHVETVDDAGRWGIEVSPVRQVAFSDEGFFNACQNRLAWDKDRPSQPYGEPYPQPQEPRVMRGGKVELKRVLFPIDELNGIACSVAQTSETRYVLAADTNRFRETSGRIMDLFPPETPLAALAPPNEAAPVQADQTTRTHWTPPRIRSASDFARAEAPAIAQGNLWAPRFGGTKLSYWDHNGSGMAWEQRDEFLWIWYFRPRAGLESAGVRPGSLLFFGTQEGGSRGLARRFSKRCEDTIYEVTKTSRITHTNVFEGPYRKRNSNCSQGASRKDRLVFDYLGTSPDQITATPDGTAPGGPMRLRGIKNSLNMRAGPAQKAPKVAVLPASLKGFTLISCRPMMAPGHWQNGNARQKQALLAERWCSLNYQGQIGYVAGKFLAPQ